MSAPGWYPDPAGSGQQRYFDGANWTTAYAPVAAAPPPPPPARAERRFTIHYGFALLAVFSLIGTLLFGIPLLAQASDPETGEMGTTLGVLWMLWGGMWTVIWIAFAIQHTLRGRR